jgi:hypothetical protein
MACGLWAVVPVLAWYITDRLPLLARPAETETLEFAEQPLTPPL